MKDWQQLEERIRRLGIHCPPGRLKPVDDPQVAYRSAAESSDDLAFERWQVDAAKQGTIVRRGIGRVLGVR